MNYRDDDRVHGFQHSDTAMRSIGADVRPPAVVASGTSASSRTRYTIDVDVHPDVASVALKHACQLPRFLEHYPISTHTREAYSRAVAFVNEFHVSRRDEVSDCETADALRKEDREGWKGISEEALEESEEEGGYSDIQKTKTTVKRKTRRLRHRRRLQVVLDSGCGTGRSTVALARCYPHLPVLGVDRSAVRLARGVDGGTHKAAPSVVGCDEEDDREAVDDIRSRSGIISGVTDCKRGLEYPPVNLLLLRADLVDLWVLASRDTAWEVVEHTILYPNPYPKRSQLRSRWHGHPVFPLILSLGGRITLRSNWKAYLDEVCLAILAIAYASEYALSGNEETPTSHLHATTTNIANRGGATPETGGVYSVGRDKGDDAFQMGSWGGRRRSITELEDTDTSPSIPDTVSAAAFSYVSSARSGPMPYMPIVPTTNFEAKYKAAGEKVYELKLDPRPSID